MPHRIMLRQYDKNGRPICCDFWHEEQAENYELHILMFDTRLIGTVRFEVTFPYIPNEPKQ